MPNTICIASRVQEDGGFRRPAQRHRSWSSVGLSVVTHVVVAACAVYVAQAHAIDPPQPRNRSISFVVVATGVGALIRSTPARTPRSGRIVPPRAIDRSRPVVAPPVVDPVPARAVPAVSEVALAREVPPARVAVERIIERVIPAPAALVVGSFASLPSTGVAQPAPARAVTSAGFDARSPGRAGGAEAGSSIADGGFDLKPAPPSPAVAPRREPIESPIEILFKPTPEYSDEARALRIEGEVILDVELAASGEVHVLGVVRGLGHGLDEAAARAASLIRFKPARSAAGKVTVRTAVHIMFRLS